MSATSITLHTDTELIDKVAALATAMDCSRNKLIEDALRQYVETQAEQIAGIKEAIISLNDGGGIAHEQVMAEMEALLSGSDGNY
ncbi:MAG: CopG family ribbon-helix-helix protein [Methylobacter sp.]